MRYSSSIIVALAALACAGHTLAHPTLHGGKIRIDRSKYLTETENDHGISYDLPKYEEDVNRSNLDLNFSEEFIHPISYIDHEDKTDEIFVETEVEPEHSYQEEGIHFERRKAPKWLKKVGSIAGTVAKTGASIAL